MNPLSPRQQPALTALSMFFLAMVILRLIGRTPWLHQFPNDHPATGLLRLGVALTACLLGLLLAHRLSPQAAFKELGLQESLGKGLAFGLLASIPMLLIFAFTSKLDFSLSRVFRFAVFGPFFEELLFRGYLLRQLYRRASWSLLPAVGTTGLVFGLAHLGSTLGQEFDVPGIFTEVGITAAGGALFGWLFLRWSDNLWVPFGLHAFMNLWSEVYGVDRDTVLSGVGNVARALCVVIAMLVTLRFTRRLERPKRNPGVA